MTANLEALLDELFKRKSIHSAVMSVVAGDGRFQWAGARGVIAPDAAPMTPEQPWFIASITKLLIAVMILRMVELGELALDDPIVDWLAPSISHKLHVLDGTDWTGRITVEHLLSHTSGLPDYIADYPKQREQQSRRHNLMDVLLTDGDRRWSLEDTTHWVRDRLNPYFAPQPLDGRKVRVRYSDTNYLLLIGIIEHCRQAPYHEALQNLILNPLKLKNTWRPGHYREPNSEPVVPTLYAGSGPIRIPQFLNSIGDLNSTCDDLINFYRAVVDGRLFQDVRSWNRMRSAWNPFAFPGDRTATSQVSGPVDYGLGVMRFRLPPSFSSSRPVTHLVGHTGSTGTWLFYAPELDVYLAGTVNQTAAAAVPFKLIPELIRIVATAQC